MARFAQGGVRREVNGRALDGLAEGTAATSAATGARGKPYARGPVQRKAIQRIPEPVVPSARMWLTDTSSGMISVVDPSTGTVLSDFAAPARISEGMVLDGETLWVSAPRAASYTTIYGLDPATGGIVTSFDSPASEFITGLAWDGTHLRANDQNGSRIWRVDPSTGTFVDSIPGGGTGLAWDGTNLWRHISGAIVQVDPSTGTTVSSFTYPGMTARDLAWGGRTVLVADSGDDVVYALRPSDGTVVGQIATPGGAPYGVEVDTFAVLPV